LGQGQLLGDPALEARAGHYRQVETERILSRTGPQRDQFGGELGRAGGVLDIHGGLTLKLTADSFVPGVA
jgi:hypothetical protein